MKGPEGVKVKNSPGPTLPGRKLKALNNKAVMINVGSEVTMVDDGVGRILDTLEDLGLNEDTLVIFTSDQGAA